MYTHPEQGTRYSVPFITPLVVRQNKYHRTIIYLVYWISEERIRRISVCGLFFLPTTFWILYKNLRFFHILDPYFLQMCNTPELCAEATLQPLRRYPSLDGVVIFSDILIVCQAMGMEVIMNPGPIFPQPITQPEDIDTLLNLSPNCDECFSKLYQGITLTRQLAAQTVRSVPVIGFCGAPWTLMNYMVDEPKTQTKNNSTTTTTTTSTVPSPSILSTTGISTPPPPLPSKEKDKAKQWLYQYPSAAHRLLQAIAKICVELLVGQYRAGASILQVFESNGGDIPPAQYLEFGFPYIKYIATEVRKRVPSLDQGGPPLLIFPRNIHNPQIIEQICTTPYNMISIDWNWNPKDIIMIIQRKCKELCKSPLGIQGNLDPIALHAPPSVLKKEIFTMLQSMHTNKQQKEEFIPIIGNLGHGMSPSHRPEQLAIFFDAIHSISTFIRTSSSSSSALLLQQPTTTIPKDNNTLEQPEATAEEQAIDKLMMNIEGKMIVPESYY